MLVWLRLCAIAPYQTHAPTQLGGSDDALVDAKRALAAAKHTVAEEESAREEEEAKQTTREGKKKQTAASRDAKQVAAARLAELQATEARLRDLVATLSAAAEAGADRKKGRNGDAFWTRWDASPWSTSLYTFDQVPLKEFQERAQSAVSTDHDVWQWRHQHFFAFSEEGVQQPPTVFMTLLCNLPADAPWLLQAGAIYPAFPPARVVASKTRREYGPNAMLYLCGFTRYVQNRACDRAVSLFFFACCNVCTDSTHTHTRA